MREKEREIELFFIFQHVFLFGFSWEVGTALSFFFFWRRESKEGLNTQLFYSLKFELIGVGCNFTFVSYTFSLVSC